MKAASPAYIEMIDFIVTQTAPDALLDFRPSQSSQQRVAELVERQQSGTLSEEDASELDNFLQLEHLLIMAKAQARLRLQLAARH